MNNLFSLYKLVEGRPVKSALLLPFIARFLFAAVLLLYFWNSALTKLGDGFAGFLFPSSGAYAQIFPRAMEAASYDISQLSAGHQIIVVLGMWAEFVLPLLVVIGLMSRVAALGMIGFILVQTMTDLFGHGAIAHAQTLGAWFDRTPDALILDQRALWVFVLLTIALKGGGALSLDRVILRNET